jgi:hypothetical protein
VNLAVVDGGDGVGSHLSYLLHLSLFCTLIIAHWGWFVNPFFKIAHKAFDSRLRGECSSKGQQRLFR